MGVAAYGSKQCSTHGHKSIWATCVSSRVNAALDVQQQLMIMQQRRRIPGRLGYGIKYVTLRLYSDGCTAHHAANYFSIFDTSSMSAAMKNMTDPVHRSKKS